MIITVTTHCAVRGYQPSGGYCIVLSIASLHDPLPYTSSSVDCIWYNDILTLSTVIDLDCLQNDMIHERTRKLSKECICSRWQTTVRASAS
jgi:hypothetical protein